jgi:hypothetical protein
MDKELLKAFLKENLTIRLEDDYQYYSGGKVTIRATLEFDGETIDSDFISFNTNN